MDFTRIKLTAHSSNGIYSARDNDHSYHVFRLVDPAFLPDGTILRVIKWKVGEPEDAVATTETDGESVAIRWDMFGGAKQVAARMLSIAETRRKIGGLVTGAENHALCKTGGS